MLHDGNSDPEQGRSPDPPSPPAPPLVAVRRGDPRRRMLDAMIQTAARRGYDRTTVSRVLASAEVPEPLFGEHFDDKHDCFMQAVDELIGRAEQAARQRFAGEAPWPQRVRAALLDLLTGLARDPDGARVVLVEMLAAGPAAAERQRRALALFTSLVEEGRSPGATSPGKEGHWPAALVEEGHWPAATSLVEEGRSPTAEPVYPPPQTSEAIVGGIASILHRRVLQGETAELPSLHAEITYFALLPYLDHERAMSEAMLRPAA